MSKPLPRLTSDTSAIRNPLQNIIRKLQHLAVDHPDLAHQYHATIERLTHRCNGLCNIHCKKVTVEYPDRPMIYRDDPMYRQRDIP